MKTLGVGLGQRPEGSHLWYLAVIPQTEGFSNIELVDRDADGEDEIGVWLRCGLFYFFDPEGNFLTGGRVDNSTCDPEKTGFVRIE